MNSCASSSRPRPKGLPALLRPDRIFAGDKLHLSCFPFKTSLSKSQVKHHSVFKPPKQEKRGKNRKSHLDIEVRKWVKFNGRREKMGTFLSMKPLKEIGCQGTSKCQALKHGIRITAGQ